MAIDGIYELENPLRLRLPCPLSSLHSHSPRITVELAISLLSTLITPSAPGLGPWPLPDRQKQFSLGLSP